MYSFSITYQHHPLDPVNSEVAKVASNFRTKVNKAFGPCPYPPEDLGDEQLRHLRDDLHLDMLAGRDVWVARTRRGELWLMMNTPTEASGLGGVR